jgi:gas vesicle protein
MAMTKRDTVNWPWFILGCFLLLFAMVAFFWAFALGTLTPDRRMLLMWILPLASGFACGCFTGALTVSGTVEKLSIGAAGGFAVWLLTYYLLPKSAKDLSQETPASVSAQEFLDKMRDNAPKLRSQLEKAGKDVKPDDQEAFKDLKKQMDAQLDAWEDAAKKSQVTRAHDASKEVLKLLTSDSTKKIIGGETAANMQNLCSKRIELSPSSGGGKRPYIWLNKQDGTRLIWDEKANKEMQNAGSHDKELMKLFKEEGHL